MQIDNNILIKKELVDMTKETKLIKVGKSTGLTIPKAILDAIGTKVGSIALIDIENNTIVIRIKNQ